ncbi:putative reverse transcriptase domain-containing protein [Tanacetum coccineum]
MHQHRWIELFSDYDCEIRYHPGKANVVADALSRKERIKPRRIRAINMTLHSSIKDKILAAQEEASYESVGLHRRLDELIKHRSDEALYYLDQIWVPLKGDVRTLIMDEAHKSKYSVHLGVDNSIMILGIEAVWPTLTKSAHFLPMRKAYKIDRLARLYLNEIIARHGVPISIISDLYSRFTSRFWQTMQETLGTKLDMNTAYHAQTDCKSERTIQTLEDMLRACVPDFGKCRSPIMWAEVGEGHLIGPELVQETTEKISQIKDRLKAACSLDPFEITERIGPVVYRLRLPKELNGVHDTFHVSNLKKCLADPTLQIPLDEIRVDAKFNFVEELVEILEREFNNLKRSIISIVKVRWNSKR